MTGLKVLSAVSEIFPLAKTGGLGDVAGALPGALRVHGVTMATLIPGYRSVMQQLGPAREVLSLDDLFGGNARVLAASAEELDLFVIDAPHLYDRPGTPYAAPDGLDWPDNALRFGALSWVAARMGLGDVPEFVPDIVHCHDWQAGLAPAYLNYAGRHRPRTILTVHNLAYQGKFPAELLAALRLPDRSYQVDGVEYYGGIGFLKAGLQFADRITTVSRSYAEEIQTPEFGLGLDGLLRARSTVLSGIANGIDTDVWNPQDDPHIPAHFDSATLERRAGNAEDLKGRFGLNGGAEGPLYGVVSRLVWQKGLDILADAAPVLVASGGRLAILGAGEPQLEAQLTELADTHRGRIGCKIGYDEDLAHLMQAGVDALLVPSRFEPCGVTQLCAMRYGAVPVVARVGGLGDTVADAGESRTAGATGFHIHPVTREGLEGALARVSGAWADKARWRQLQLNGMRKDVSWVEPATHYTRLYTNLISANN